MEKLSNKLGSMGNDTFYKRGEGKLNHAVTINIDRDHKAKYDKLTKEHQLRVAEHLRRVIYPELDRLIERMSTQPNDAA